MIGEGPKERFEAELQKCGKAGLLEFIDMLITIYIPRYQREFLELAQSARRHGKFEERMKRHDKFLDDPDAYHEAALQRQLNKLRSARRKKKGTR